MEGKGPVPSRGQEGNGPSLCQNRHHVPGRVGADGGPAVITPHDFFLFVVCFVILILLLVNS